MVVVKGIPVQSRSYSSINDSLPSRSGVESKDFGGSPGEGREHKYFVSLLTMRRTSLPGRQDFGRGSLFRLTQVVQGVKRRFQ